MYAGGEVLDDVRRLANRVSVRGRDATRHVEGSSNGLRGRVWERLTGARESSEMNQVPQHVGHDGEPQSTHDGLAAVAIALLFVALVIFMIVKLV